MKLCSSFGVSIYGSVKYMPAEMRGIGMGCANLLHMHSMPSLCTDAPLLTHLPASLARCAYAELRVEMPVAYVLAAELAHALRRPSAYVAKSHYFCHCNTIANRSQPLQRISPSPWPGTSALCPSA